MRNRFRSLAIRYEYLFRLSLTVCTVLLLPALLAGFMITDRAYGQVESQNNEYYTERVYRFGQFYTGQTRQLMDIAVRITLDRRFIQSELEGHPYNRVDAIKILADYSLALPYGEFIGLHFYDSPYILTSKYAYSLDQFSQMISSGGRAPIDISAALSAESDGFVTMYSAFDGDNDPANARLLGIVSISTELNGQKNAAVLFSMNASTLSAGAAALSSGDAAGLAIFDAHNRPFFYNSGFARTLTKDDAFLAFLDSEKTTYFEPDGQDGDTRIYKWRDAGSGLTFVTVEPQNVVLSNVRAFYRTTSLMLGLTVLAMLMMAVFVVYINYKPLYKMVTGLPPRPGEGNDYGELTRIKRTMDSFREEHRAISETVIEQRLMLMESALGNILYGIPVSPDRLALLAPEVQNRLFCVLSVADLRLDNQSREQLTAALQTELDITVYITDILEDTNMAVLLILRPSQDGGTEAQRVRDVMQTLYHREFVMGTGSTVNSLDDLRTSYHDARSALEREMQAYRTQKKPVNRHLGRLLLDYVNEHFTVSGISLMQVSDQFGISVYTCSRLFKEFTGIGFKEYVAAKRMERAKELLITTNLNIYEVAAQAGFENSSYFVTWFKTNTGVSPGRFREDRCGSEVARP